MLSPKPQTEAAIWRYGAGQLHEDFDVLPRGVKDFHHGRVGHQLEEGLQTEAVRERIDKDGLVGRCRLQQAQFRPVGGFTKKFCVDCDEVVCGRTFAELGEHVSRGY
jgi:hypothetical protein